MCVRQVDRMTNGEEFKPIERISGYSVSNFGKVRNDKTGRILKPAINKHGYSDVFIKGKHYKVHRLVAETFLANNYNLPQVNHIDGVKTNNFIENLEWVSCKDNVKHSINTGLRKCKKVMIAETGETFTTVSECAKKIDGDVGDIYRCLWGKTKTHKGYHFKEIKE